MAMVTLYCGIIAIRGIDDARASSCFSPIMTHIMDFSTIVHRPPGSSGNEKYEPVPALVSLAYSANPCCIPVIAERAVLKPPVSLQAASRSSMELS